MPTSELLRIEGLKAGYGDIEILHGISMSVKKGEVVAVIGPNGSGKSTLFKSIFNLCDIYSGKIIWQNADITNEPTHSKIARGIAYIPQGRQIFKSLSVRENLEMGAFTINNETIVERKIEEIFREFPFLKQREHDLAFTLSGGQQQMLAIATALMLSPKLLLLDEPSLGLSPKSTNAVFNKIREINKQGVAIAVVEQNVKKALEIANRIYVLKEGSLSLHRKTITKKELSRIYFGD